MPWWSGPGRARAGRAGVADARGARHVFDSGSAGSAPANAGSGRGPGARDRHGRPQGDKGYVQDMLVEDFGAGLPSGRGGGHVHGMDV